LDEQELQSLVDPHLKTEDNTNGVIQVLVLGDRAGTSNRGRSEVSQATFFNELRARGLVYSQEPSTLKSHQRNCGIDEG
jgi:hypothetical protein